MTELPKSVRARLAAQQSRLVDHPDPDLLTAFAENALPERERERVSAHLALCGDCREVLALAAPVVPEAVAAVPRRAWVFRPVVRWAAVAVAGVVIVTAVSLRHNDSARIANRRDLPAVAQMPPAPAPSLPGGSSEAREQAVRPELQTDKRKTAAKSNGELLRDRKDLDLEKGSVAAAKPAENKTTNEMKQEVAEAAGTIRRPVRSAEVGGSRGPAPPTQQQVMAQQQAQSAITQQPAEAQKSVATNADSVAAAAPVVAAVPAAPRPSSAPQQAMKSGAIHGLAAETNRPQDLAKKTAPAYAPSQDVVTGAPTSRSDAFTRPVSWGITPDHQVQRRLGDAPPEVVAVASGVRFRAVASVGPDVWAGGTGGALFKSSDRGAHWTHVPLPTADDVVRIEFSSVREGSVTTAGGGRLATFDGGQSWVKQ